MSEVVSYQRQGTLALITVNNPPVNALGIAVRQGLQDAFRAAEDDAEVKAVVLVCEGNTFIAGADIKEFGKPPQSPSLPEVIESIEQGSKPSVAVIHGTALGGGLEVALGCHYRIARKDAQVGLPEVKLGLLPGAGGTQRLPRVAGVAKALDMIVSGAPIKAAEAVQFNIVDELFEGDLREAGIAYAQKLLSEGKGPRRTGEQTAALEGVDNAGLVAAKHAEVAKRMRGLFSPLRCIAAVEASFTLPLAEGLKRERELFSECLSSPQRASLVYSFFSERQASKVNGLDPKTPTRKFEKVAVIGGGTMGVGIALSFANAGIPVRILEISAEARDKAMERAAGTYAASVKRGSLTQDAMDKRMALVSGVTDYADLADVDLVIEAVFEDMGVKQKVFEQLDAVCKPGAILASNTSSLDLNVIAGFTKRPQDVVGLHFFSPANVMRLLEVVRAEKTSDEVLATALAIGKKLKKVSVVVGVCDGFVGNRMVFQYGRESEFLLEEGATPEQVDGALKDFGMAMGPTAMRDLSGLDIGWSIRKRQRQELSSEYKLPCLLDKLCEKGWLGQKTGKGFFVYEAGSRTPQPNPDLQPLLEAASQEQGVERRALSNEFIVERTIFALINEGAKILEEGIAQRASDIDVIYLNGYGFPAYRGGPMFYADTLGLDKVLACVEEFHKQYGAWWKPAPLLQKLAAEGRKFADWQAGE